MKDIRLLVSAKNALGIIAQKVFLQQSHNAKVVNNAVLYKAVQLFSFALKACFFCVGMRKAVGQIFSVNGIAERDKVRLVFLRDFFEFYFHIFFGT